MVGHIVLHVLDPDKLKAALVCTEDVVALRAEYGALADLYPRLQVLKMEVLEKVSDQVNEVKLWRRSATSWLCGLRTASRSMLISPSTMGPLKGLLEVW